MKILGIDFGTKRIGVAISDENAGFARELAIWPPAQFMKRLAKLLQTEDVGEIVVGLPLNMAGADSKKTEEARAFAETLKQKTGRTVVLQDERLSSAMAHRLPGGEKNTDSLAAQIILQNYLDKQKRN